MKHRCISLSHVRKPTRNLRDRLTAVYLPRYEQERLEFVVEEAGAHDPAEVVDGVCTVVALRDRHAANGVQIDDASVCRPEAGVRLSLAHDVPGCVDAVRFAVLAGKVLQLDLCAVSEELCCSSQAAVEDIACSGAGAVNGERLG